MRKLSAPFLAILAFAPFFAAWPSIAASRPLPEPPQAPCAAVNLKGNDTKFTGQISSGPNGSLFEVSSGNESVLVRYASSVPVCVAGHAGSVSALSMGETVVVYGQSKRKGKVTEMDAVSIVVAGNSQAVANTSESRGPGMAQSGYTASGSQVANAGSGETPKTGAAISCNAILFTVNSAADPSGHTGLGRGSSGGITCKRSVDQLAVQLSQDALTRHRIPNVTLSWQNQLDVALSNPEITSVQFTSDNGNQSVEITYSYQRADVTYVPTGTRVTF